jgi:hypothetical protein
VKSPAGPCAPGKWAEGVPGGMPPPAEGVGRLEAQRSKEVLWGTGKSMEGKRAKGKETAKEGNVFLSEL